MKLKQMGIALITAGMLSANAYASEVAVEQALAPQETLASRVAFTETDLNLLFEQEAGKPMQLAALSQQEMKETDGALAPVVLSALGWTSFGGLLGTGTYLYRTPRSQWSWGGAGRAFGAGATAGFFKSMGPVAKLGRIGSYTVGAFGAATWYR